jgi:hypothetical protein
MGERAGSRIPAPARHRRLSTGRLHPLPGFLCLRVLDPLLLLAGLLLVGPCLLLPGPEVHAADYVPVEKALKKATTARIEDDERAQAEVVGRSDLKKIVSFFKKKGLLGIVDRETNKRIQGKPAGVPADFCAGQLRIDYLGADGMCILAFELHSTNIEKPPCDHASLAYLGSGHKKCGFDAICSRSSRKALVTLCRRILEKRLKDRRIVVGTLYAKRNRFVLKTEPGGEEFSIRGEKASSYVGKRVMVTADTKGNLHDIDGLDRTRAVLFVRGKIEKAGGKRVKIGVIVEKVGPDPQKRPQVIPEAILLAGKDGSFEATLCTRGKPQPGLCYRVVAWLDRNLDNRIAGEPFTLSPAYVVREGKWLDEAGREAGPLVTGLVLALK